MKTTWLVLFVLIVAWIAIGAGCDGTFSTRDAIDSAKRQPGGAPPPDPDKAIGNTLQNIGAILGVPLLSGLGFLFGRAKPIRRCRQLVEAWQVGRADLKERGKDAALARLDEVVGGRQRAIKGMEKFVRSVKKKANIRSVNGPGPRS